MQLTHEDLQALARLVADEVKALATTGPGRWLTIQEAKEYAKVRSINTLKKWIKAGLIYAFRRSGKGNWIIDRESIDEFYNSEKIS